MKTILDQIKDILAEVIRVQPATKDCCWKDGDMPWWFGFDLCRAGVPERWYMGCWDETNSLESAASMRVKMIQQLAELIAENLSVPQGTQEGVSRR